MKVEAGGVRLMMECGVEVQSSEWVARVLAVELL